ncbi:DUF5672 family protein [Pseudanabaena sp. FACHB-2040]|uniref:DUF5672 family protein n=1 Tax=Pseudanabaena sp. FACHB-2040 TaxID=2692859 RepID=UPI0016868136|nr:DUF5672 family protein [Pseudanabaena sp. FACHB-2040]MBD2257273.1 hypothetical protein [Pseudanabaena sp. FACHB-2040]
MSTDLRVAVVLPLYKPDFNEYEKISFLLADHVLANHTRVIVKPHSLNLKFSGWTLFSFDDWFFRSHNNYSQLLLDIDFYTQFKDFDYILIYQLDSLVLSDRLLEWCQKQYDYIGPLWDRNEIEFWENVTWNYVDFGCGNGGFSLRKVSSCIEALRGAIAEAQRALGKDTSLCSFGDMIQRYSSLLHKGKVFSNNEDMFWGFWANRFKGDFKLGSLEDSLAFGFEYNPEKCLTMNHGELPFGAHAWFKFKESREFWLRLLNERFDLEQLIKEFDGKRFRNG